MPRRVKEEERTEMIIRGLLKQPENRRCINCNSLGPQYVCTTYWTFVCTNCSGVHREFTHRVKSVSMAKFNNEEILALQAGGNERAKQIYFKAWDPQRNYYPDGSNLQRLREFVKNVYLDRRYAGGFDNNHSKLSTVKSDPSNSSDERRSFDYPSRISREGFFERRSLDSNKDEFYGRSSFEGPKTCIIRPKPKNLKDLFEERSPRNFCEYPRSSSQRGRVARFEIVDDRFRDDGTVKKYERYQNKESISGNRSPQMDKRSNNLPSVRPIRDILGEKAPTLKVDEPQKLIAGKEPKCPDSNQKVSVADPQAPVDDKQKQTEVVNQISLIDFEDNIAPLSNNESNVEERNTNNSVEILFDLSAPESSSYSDVQPQITTKQEVSTSDSFQSGSMEKSSQERESKDGSNLSARKELPADLFTLNFGGFTPTPVASWQTQPYQGMALQGFSGPSRPSNPFDVGDDVPQGPVTMFPSMTPIQGSSLPSIPHTTASHVSPYLANMSQASGAYRGEDAFASINPIHQQSMGSNSLPGASDSSLSRRGNPFG